MTPPLDPDAFPVTARWAYLNHAGVAAPPQVAVDAMTGAVRQAAADGALAVEDQKARVEEVRAAAGRVLGVPAPDVAFVKNTTEGLGFVASGLQWRPGDRVVLPDLEFPSTAYPWLALRDRGVRVDLVRPQGPGRTLAIDAFADVVRAGPAPRVVATSWVQFSRGWRTDLAGLAGLCHEVGALLCADVIQGVGVMPAELEAWGVDFAMADAHKWLLGPSGVGVLYVRGSCLDLLRPLEPGWSSVAHREDWDNLDLTYDTSARRLEGGSANLTGIAAMGASMDLLLSAGVDAVWDHVDGLCDHLVDGLSGLGGVDVLSDRSPGGRSGIVTFGIAGRAPDTVCQVLQGVGIVCSPRGGGIRVSPHGYNGTDELDGLIAQIRRIAVAT